MSIAPPPAKLFVLRAFKSSSGFSNNSHLLWQELDRGWKLDCYEVIYADPAGTDCDVLVKLTNPKGVSATPPDPVPAPQSPFPDEKLLLLGITDAAAQVPATELWAELDRGWSIDCYEVIFKSATGECYVLIKMSNRDVQQVPALPPGS